MKWTTIFVAAAILVISSGITYAENGQGQLQGKMIEVKITNETNYRVIARLTDHYCMYDVNKNKHFDIAPGGVAQIKAETKASGACFLCESRMNYFIHVVQPNSSPIVLGECKIKNPSMKWYEWQCLDKRVGDFEMKNSRFNLYIRQK